MEKVKKKKIITIFIWTSCIVLSVLLFSLLYVYVWKVPSYKVSLFNNIGMSNILQGEGEYNEGEEVIITATKVSGYSFINWTYQESVVSEDYSYTFIISSQNCGEYVANYIERDFLIKKESSNGSFDVSQNAKAGENILITNIVADKGFTLEKLYYCEYGSDEQIEIENNSFIMPANNVTIFAVFSPLEYKIDIQTYDNGNISISQNTAIYGQEIQVSVETIIGYQVERLYYLSQDGETEIEIINNKFYMPDYSIKIYAEIQLATYSIKYNLNGGNADGFVYSYNIFSQSIEVPNPTKDGYTFLGWIGSNLTIATRDLVIGSGTWGNLEFSALWEKNPIT